ncbi:MAG TPA: hypothetical protein DDZ88_00420 [Verrucomicrobiales bacterium]|nr:hypothetical protein [Verrucomicrobiales bacterium]
MRGVLSFQKLLLLNWLIAPALCLTVMFRIGFIKGVLFFILWLGADWIWEKMTSMLLGMVSGSLGDYGQFKAAMYGEIPFRMALVMIVDVLGHLAVPWLVGGYFLGWY